MANTQGIIFSDVFINNKDLFVKKFAEYYKKNQIPIIESIKQLDSVLTTYDVKSLTPTMARQFKNAWNQFQKVVLLNEKTDLELIVAFREGQGGRTATFSEIVKQEQFEGTGQTQYGKKFGIQAGNFLLKENEAYLAAQDVQNFLQIHLNGFLLQLEQPITYNEAKLLHAYHEYCLSNYLQNTDISLVNMPWYKAFYTSNNSQYFGGQGLGQAYDAYMNHMANKETGIYDFLKHNGLQGSPAMKFGLKTQTVFEEEGGIGPEGKFPKLLRDSTNHIGWYTGGDIVIISKDTMEIVYNIQLKTTNKKNPSIFGERISQIRNFLNQLKKIDTNQYGEKIFDFFLTSVSNTDDFNNVLQATVDDILEAAIDKRINIR